MSRKLFYIIGGWLALVAAAFYFNYAKTKRQDQEMAFATAQAVIDMVKLTRQWNAGHGGVYVRVDEHTRPNPYLQVPRRDLMIDGKLTLTKVNPAFMTRQLSALARRQGRLDFRLTSLRPINPQNRPDTLESRFLRDFERGARERGSFFTENGRTYCFYIVPLRTRKVCLQCHARQGYRLGDIRGAISVRFPWSTGKSLPTLLCGYAVIGFFGVFGIIIFGLKLGAAYQKLERQASVDALTGILNRRCLLERLPQEWRRCQRYRQPLAVVMIDIDDFKAYNDAFGHVEGDECLRQVAREINASLARPSDFCARYGGEEFIIVLPDTDRDGARHVAEKIRAQVEKLGRRHPKSPAGVITLSLGVAVSGMPAAVAPEELVKRADAALYRAKRQGKNRVCLDNSGH